VLALLFVSSVLLPPGFESPWKIRFFFGPRPAYGQVPPGACDASDPQLAATDDADCDDPFITELASSLGHDAGAIFAYTRDVIGYEAYRGSLRGARGAFSAKAGNGFDQASLMVALLRASGIPARYARGTLDGIRARELVESVFPDPRVVSSFVPAGVPRGDPASDASLLAEAADHVWVEFDDGSGLTSADPSFAGATLGQSFAVAAETFDEVPAALRHTVRIVLRRESALPFAGLLGADPIGEATVLDESFSAPALFGRPVSLAHFVTQSQLAGPVFGSITNSYTPYLVVSDVARSTADIEPILGTPYTEVLTSFPFGSSVLTGLFLRVELGHPDGSSRTLERALADRIGFDVRTSGGVPNLTFDADSPPLVTDLDVFTLNVSGGRFDLAFDTMLDDLSAVSDSIAAAEGTGDTSGTDAAQLRRGAIAMTAALSSAFLLLSDLVTDALASATLVRAYPDALRVFITSNRLDIDTGASTQVRLSRSIDLLHDPISALPFPGQAADAARAFLATRGVLQTNVERNIFAAILFPGDGCGPAAAATVLEEAVARGVPLVTLGPG